MSNETGRGWIYYHATIAAGVQSPDHERAGWPLLVEVLGEVDAAVARAAASKISRTGGTSDGGTALDALARQWAHRVR